MAFQSSVLRDGEWVTETVNFQDALKASTAPKPAAEPRPEVPTCGILSSTIVESPVVHWVLPVRLRSQLSNDVAFIGDRFVQISELRDDGQVHEVLRKSDFGTRIRNAIVLGSSPQDSSDNDPSSLIKPEDSDVLMQDATKVSGTERLRPLPPQMLVLMLESGDGVFLFIRERANGSLEFITTRYESPRNLKFLGFHLSVDPTSRYMAAASAEGAFIVYELESLEDLSAQYTREGSFNPVKSIRIRQVNGVIHKMEFLHPRPEDDYHIILLLIIARREGNRHTYNSRMVYYEWELGDELKSVFAKEKVGVRLPEEHQMPLLLIPLRFNTAFFVVSEQCIGIVKCALEGTPHFDLLPTNAPGQTKLHHGAAEPLWTAWARPFRRQQYFEKTDIIYLAREDGVLIHVEIEASEIMNVSLTNAGAINTNISTAFTTAYDVFADVLIIGGDSGPGGIWKLPARSDLGQVSTIPNWSPVIDLATTDECPSWTAETQATEVISRRKASSNVLRKPNRIFSRIGLEFEWDQPVRQSWMFPVEIRGEMGFYALLSLPHSSDVLHLPSDLTNANALTPDASPFDTTSRTIYAVQNEQMTIVQITETSVTLVAPSQSSRHYHADVIGPGDIVAENAFCKDDLVNDCPTLSFIDPDSGTTISSAADKDMQSSEYISGLGHIGDKVFGLTEWLYVKDGRTFPFIIVTTQQGLLLIVSVTVEEIETTNGRIRHLRYWTRYKKKGFEDPIYSAVGDAAGLLFCVGSVLHWEVLDLVEKKLKPMKQFRLDSPAISLQMTNGKACVLTTSHSLQVIDLHVESEVTDVSLVHSDQVTRYTWHLIEVGDSVDRSRKWPVNLVSTAQGGIAGLWVPWGQRNKELGVVFEGTLSTSVRRFRRGRTRPLWLSVDRERRYNSLSSTVDGAEILGVSLDGSLQHFSLIGLELWRFLRLIQNLAQLSTAISPFTHGGSSGSGADMDVDVDMELEPQLFPEMMHINGDLLRRCLELRALKNLTAFGDGLDLFCEYLDGIDDGAYTEGFRDGVDDGRERYLELGYDILEYLLAPVF
ncbi:hypothetical protein G7Z17_g7475 [Cylindrodendrum hubeiense]|uniref:RSE1/DDB1/CPSF1 first beta-propeller domain-containing protein n=1 Tax=Cylindrodendrum hubeiense TaxID=595255 RepID=A0A9P5H7T9_9HYPO|nr:hypothetical protein G7Z17_g7475 [Cylindrodendrum hubeiense]